MKINDSIKQPIDLAVDKTNVSSNKKTAQTGTSSSAASENVTLSTMASQMKALEAKVANAEVFDAQKVDAIKSAIASGQFTVDSEKIADGLVASVRDFLSTQNCRDLKVTSC